MTWSASKAAAVELKIGAGLAVRLHDLPEQLSSAVCDFFSYYRVGNNIEGDHEPPIELQFVASVDSDLLGGQVVIDEPTLVVRQSGPRLSFSSIGGAGWCDPESGRGELTCDEMSPGAAARFVARPLVAMFFQLAAARGWHGLHAAAIVVGGTAVVLPGSSGCGKTTLSLAARDSGLGFLSDDLVWLRESDGGFQAVPFPRGLPFQDIHPPTQADAPLGAVVFPTISRSAATSKMTRLDSSEALLRMCSQAAFLHSSWTAKRQFLALAVAADAVPCFALSAGSRPEEAVTVVVEALRGA